MSSILPQTIINDPRVISARNRGPITSNVALPASCLATLSFSTTSNPVDGETGDLYVEHYGSVFDSNCFPTGSNEASASALDDWGLYYCTLHTQRAKKMQANPE